MSFSDTFIRRPVATTLLTIAIALAGVAAFRLLPVAPLPRGRFSDDPGYGNLPGASPETMASSVATPLERQFGRIAGVTEMTSTSSLGTTELVLQFDLNRNIDAAARDVQAAINAARGQLAAQPAEQPDATARSIRPTAPIMILALTSRHLRRGRCTTPRRPILAQKLSQVQGVGQVTVGGRALPGVRIELNPDVAEQLRHRARRCRAALCARQRQSPEGRDRRSNEARGDLAPTTSSSMPHEYRPLIVAYRNGAPVRLSRRGQRHRFASKTSATPACSTASRR